MFAHELWDHTTDCPVHDVGKFTITVEGDDGGTDGTDGTDGNGNNGGNIGRNDGGGGGGGGGGGNGGGDSTQQGNWPELSIDDVTVDEDAGSAAFTVSMSRASAETGLGVEIGGGMRYAHPALDLTIEFDVHGLLAHEVDGVSELGASGSIRYDPFSNSDQGPSLRLSSSWGAQDTRGLDALWQRESAIGSLVDADSGPTRSPIPAQVDH